MPEFNDQYRVIAIDDEQDILDYYREVLSPSTESELVDSLNNLLELSNTSEEEKEEEESDEHPFDLITTTSGEEGFNILQQSLEEGAPFAVAFIDMRMPAGWDGLKTAKEIRAIDPYVTIIFLTAYMDYSLSDIRHSIGDHFSFLSKPINREELHQVALTTSKTWQQLREVRRLNKSKDDFLASISHELRTPLTAIIGNAEIILEEAGETLEYAHHSMLETILKAGQGQLALVNDILDISKIQAGRFQINNKNFNLQELLNDIESLFHDKTAQQGVEFTIHIDHPPQHLLIGDAQRIHQILLNLLSNAFKFTDQGEVRLEVNIADPLISFKVTDSGIGIDKKVLKRLFKPFEQADSSTSRRFGGTGLGLSISKSLATMMDGTLHAESEEGVGSTFTVTLPLLMGGELAEEGKQKRATEAASKQRYRGKVLLAEDTPELQALLRHMLERRGVEVVIANNGQEAVELALQEQMDLILMDMQMPVMNGIEATQMLRNTFYTAPIAALTANVMDDHKRQFEEAGTNDFLSKPVDKDALMELLSKYLEPSDDQGTETVEQESQVNSELVELFKKELVKNANQLRDALYIDNLNKIQQVAHILKGTGSSFGYDELSKIGKEVCDAHHQENHDKMRKLSNDMLMMALDISNEAHNEDHEEPGKNGENEEH